MIKWTRPSGSAIELEDTENLNAFAESQGWLREDKPKRKRRTKAEIEADQAALVEIAEG